MKHLLLTLTLLSIPIAATATPVTYAYGTYFSLTVPDFLPLLNPGQTQWVFTPAQLDSCDDFSPNSTIACGGAILGYYPDLNIAYGTQLLWDFNYSSYEAVVLTYWDTDLQHIGRWNGLKVSYATTTYVPEPATIYLMLLFGLLMVGWHAIVAGMGLYEGHKKNKHNPHDAETR